MLILRGSLGFDSCHACRGFSALECNKKVLYAEVSSSRAVCGWGHHHGGILQIREFFLHGSPTAPLLMTVVGPKTSLSPSTPPAAPDSVDELASDSLSVSAETVPSVSVSALFFFGGRFATPSRAAPPGASGGPASSPLSPSPTRCRRRGKGAPTGRAHPSAMRISSVATCGPTVRLPLLRHDIFAAFRRAL